MISQQNESDSDSEEQYTSRALYLWFLVSKLMDIHSDLQALLLTENMQAADQFEIK